MKQLFIGLALMVAVILVTSLRIGKLEQQQTIVLLSREKTNTVQAQSFTIIGTNYNRQANTTNVITRPNLVTNEIEVLKFGLKHGGKSNEVIFNVVK